MAARSTYEAGPICAQAARAIAILGSCGLEPRRAIEVEVARAPIPLWQRQKAGEFDPVLARIRLLPGWAMPRPAGQGVISGPAGPRLMPSSVAAHEVAHAVFFEHARHLDLAETAHEYVAYVVQLSTLPAQARDEMQAALDVPVITNLLVFSPFLLKADPERFALAAWRHFQQPENGCDFIDRLLQAKVHFPPGTD